MASVQAHTVGRLSSSELFSRLAVRREWEKTHLRQLSAVRSYKVKTDKGRVLASEKVLMEYRAPNRETFTTRSGNGSQYIRSHVFRKLMKFEADKIRLGKDQDSMIAPGNYTLQLVGEDTLGGAECLIVRAFPLRKERQLFRGTIWIEAQNFAILKIAGDLAKSPSFWVKNVHFAREYLKVGEFWLPSSEQAVSQVRLFGQATLTIDYYDYTINGGSDGSISAVRPEHLAARHLVARRDGY